MAARSFGSCVQPRAGGQKRRRRVPSRLGRVRRAGPNRSSARIGFLPTSPDLTRTSTPNDPGAVPLAGTRWATIDSADAVEGVSYVMHGAQTIKQSDLQVADALADQLLERPEQSG